MKKITISIITLAAALIGFTSCKKIIEKTPEMYLSDQTALTSVEGLQAAIIGTYNALTNGDIYGGNAWACGDMIANNVKPSGQGNIVYEETQMLEKNMSPDNRLTASFWQNAFYVINMANTILQAVPNVNPPASIANQINGECLFIRGMMYFDMVRYIGNPNNGLGVPLLTSPTGIDGKPSRAQITDIYAQIVADLTQAASLLPESNDNRATSWAAKALLSRVYFYLNDDDNCIALSTEVINSGKYSLVDSVEDNFLTVITSEIIFALLATQQQPISGTLMGYYRYASNGKFSPSVDILKLYILEPVDQRYRKFFVNHGGKTFLTMFDERYMNIPLIRLAELYLNRGECRYNKEDITGALEDINIVRQRAGVSLLTSIIPNKSFYYERARELMFQGDNFFNMKRMQKEQISDLKLPWNSVRLMYLIPQREMDVNPNLVQNQ